MLHVKLMAFLTFIFLQGVNLKTIKQNFTKTWKIGGSVWL